MKTKIGVGFTLIELLVGISIISIMALGISSFNLNRLSERQRIDIEVSKISNIIEETRNNALIGRGIGINLITPDLWNIQIDNSSSSGSISVFFNTGGLNLPYQDYTLAKPFSFLEVTCGNIDSSTTQSSTGSNSEITYIGSSVSLSGTGCSSIAKPSILDIKIGTPSLNKTLRIETLTNIIETL